MKSGLEVATPTLVTLTRLRFRPSVTAHLDGLRSRFLACPNRPRYAFAGFGHIVSLLFGSGIQPAALTQPIRALCIALQSCSAERGGVTTTQPDLSQILLQRESVNSELVWGDG